MNTVGKFTINPLSKKSSSDEMEFIDELNLSKEVGYEFPHYYSDNTITGYRAAIIKCDEVDVDYIEQIYKLKPNKVYCYNNTRHLIFYFRNSLNKYDYNRVTKALEFLYKGKHIDYHFYPLNGVVEEFSSDELNESLSDICTKLYFFQQQSIKYQKLFTISEFDKYLEVEKLEIKEVVMALYKSDVAIIPDVLKLIDIKNNIHIEYGNAFSFVHHYYSSIERAKQFFKNDFKIGFEETNSFDYTKAKEGIVIKEGENLFLSEFGYFSLDPSGNNKRLTDFYIKVHAKIVGKDGKHFFVVTLVNQGEGTETKKMIWENKTSGTTFSDFIQSYGPYHYYGGPAFIKELHRQISSTKQIPTIQQAIGYGHHESEGIIIFKNGIWDIKERLFTKKKDNNDDYYYNYDSRGYWVTDNGGNSLTEVLSTGVPNLNVEGVVEMGDILSFMSKLYADNSGSYLIFLAFGMMGYLTYGDQTKTFPLIFTRGVTGCVDSETEYLTPTGWKFIKDYKKGDIIGEFNKDTGKCIFNKPLDYIKEKDDRLAYRIKTKNIDMLLTEEHRVLSQSQRDIYSTIQLGDLVEDLEKHKHHKTNKCNIPTVFDIEDKKGIDLSDAEIQLMVAIIADGHFPNSSGKRGRGNYCRINIKKDLKKNRLRFLLKKCNINYKEKNTNPKDLKFTTFFFNTPRNDKVFTEYYWGCNKSQLKIIAEEVRYWDGNIDKRNGSTHFYTTIKESADFVQYALLITNQTRTSNLLTEVKGKTYGNNNQYTRISNDMEIISTQQKKKATRIEYKDITREKLTDGNKYCFTTNTSYWIARRNGKIFITGNSGKSAFNELLQRVWGIKKAGTDFENSTLFTMTVTLSYLIKFPYFIAEYREAASQRLQKVGTLRSVFDKISQTKGRADQSVVKYDYVATPVLDGEEMIEDGALRTRSLQLQLLRKHKIKGNFSKILREGGPILDKLMFTYLSKSTGDKYQNYLDEGYEFFKKQTSQNRIAQNVASIYAGCMAFNSEKDNEEQYKVVLSEIVAFQEEDVKENSTSMQILKVISKFMETTYNGVYPLKDKVIISWNALEEYVNRYRVNTTLKLNSYKEHLIMMGFDIKFIEVGIEGGLVEGIIIPYKLIPKNLLVHPETYKFYKDWKNLSSNQDKYGL